MRSADLDLQALHQITHWVTMRFLAYSKSDQTNLSPRERRAVAALVKAIESSRDEKR